jgi:hypothetical protein
MCIVLIYRRVSRINNKIGNEGTMGLLSFTHLVLLCLSDVSIKRLREYVYPQTASNTHKDSEPLVCIQHHMSQIYATLWLTVGEFLLFVAVDRKNTFDSIKSNISGLQLSRWYWSNSAVQHVSTTIPCLSCSCVCSYSSPFFILIYFDSSFLGPYSLTAKGLLLSLGRIWTYGRSPP